MNSYSMLSQTMSEVQKSKNPSSGRRSNTSSGSKTKNKPDEIKHDSGSKRNKNKPEEINLDSGPEDTDPNVPDRSYGDYYCKVCDSHMNSDNMWEAHVTGKRHLKNVKKGDTDSKYEDLDNEESNIKYEIRNVKDPIIGLSYIHEIRRREPNVPPLYNCFLCHASIATVPLVIEHVISMKHRLNFIKENSPEEYQLLDATNLKKGYMEPLVLETATRMEEKFGRGTVKVKQEKKKAPPTFTWSKSYETEHDEREILPRNNTHIENASVWKSLAPVSHTQPSFLGRHERSRSPRDTIGRRERSRSPRDTIGRRERSRSPRDTIGRRERSRSPRDTIGRRERSRSPRDGRGTSMGRRERSRSPRNNNHGLSKGRRERSRSPRGYPGARKRSRSRSPHPFKESHKRYSSRDLSPKRDYDSHSRNSDRNRLDDHAKKSDRDHLDEYKRKSDCQVIATSSRKTYYDDHVKKYDNDLRKSDQKKDCNLSPPYKENSYPQELAIKNTSNKYFEKPSPYQGLPHEGTAERTSSEGDLNNFVMSILMLPSEIFLKIAITRVENLSLKGIDELKLLYKLSTATQAALTRELPSDLLQFFRQKSSQDVGSNVSSSSIPGLDVQTAMPSSSRPTKDASNLKFLTSILDIVNSPNSPAPARRNVPVTQNVSSFPPSSVNVPASVNAPAFASPSAYSVSPSTYQTPSPNSYQSAPINTYQTTPTNSYPSSSANSYPGQNPNLYQNVNPTYAYKYPQPSTSSNIPGLTLTEQVTSESHKYDYNYSSVPAANKFPHRY